MKKIVLFIINTILITQAFGQSYTDKKGNTHLWGNIELEDLTHESYIDWYSKNYEAHESKLTPKEGALLKDTKVKVFLGTWCGDTKYLVPRFIKTWNQMGLNIKDIEFIALHNIGDKYKQGPNGETMGLNIHRVPTFIFEKEGMETGRIVERTVFDLDTDVMQIAKGNPYEERYQCVVILDKIMNELPADSLFIKSNLNAIYNNIRREVSGSGELNTYGYVLKAQGEFKKAEFVFLLNSYLFPYTPNVHDSYGELLVDLERWEEARPKFEEVLRLKGTDENAINQLHIIYSKLNEIKVND